MKLVFLKSKQKRLKKSAQLVELLKQNMELLRRNVELKVRIEWLEDRIARQPHIDCVPLYKNKKNMLDVCSQLLDDAATSSQRID